MGIHSRRGRNSVRLATLPFMALTAFVSTGVRADEVKPDAADVGVYDIVVTAEKRSESVNKVPMTLQAIGREALQTRNIATVSDLTKLVPGFSATEAGYGTRVFSLRGVGLNDYGAGSTPAVAVYVDEIALGLPMMVGQAPLDVERVEVLKGPQGTLYGQSSTGGAINYIAAKPTDTFQAGVTFNGTSWGRMEGTGYVSGPLSSTLKARLAVRGVGGGDWQYSTTRKDKLGAEDVKQARLLLDWEPTDNLTVKLNVNGFLDRSATQAPQLTVIHPVDPSIAHPDFLAHPIVTGDNRAADWDAAWPMDRHDRFGQVALRADYEFAKDVKVTALFAHQGMKFHHYFEYDATQITDATSAQYGDFKTTNAELRFSGQTGPANWIIGASYERGNVNDNVYSGIPWYTGGQPFPDIPRLQTLQTKLLTEIKTYGLFADAQFQVADAFKVYGGIRYSNSHRYGSSCNYPSDDANLAGRVIDRLQQVYIDLGVKTTPLVPVLKDTCLALDNNINPIKVILDLHQSNTSFRVGADYTFNSGILLYANFRRGFKDGMLPIIPGFFANQSVPATQERLDAWEAGIKAPLFDRKVQLNVAGFYYDYKDKQVLGNINDPFFGVLTRPVNVPKSRIWGLEGEITARPITGLTLTAHATYLNSKIIANFVNVNAQGLQGDLYGSRLPFTPSFEGMADANYDFPVAESFNGFVGGSVTHRGRTNNTFDNAAVPAPDFVIVPYTLFSLRAGVRGQDDSWRVSAWVENLTNKFYWHTAFTSADSTFRYTGMPRTFGLTVSIKTK